MTSFYPIAFLAVAFSATESSAQISSFPYVQNFEGFTLCAPSFCSFSCILSQSWGNDTGDDIDWIADNNGTPIPGSGPTVDHTTGTSAGKYLYLWTNAISCQNANANLHTPYFDFSGYTAPNVSFWYHMYGDDMGAMHLDADTNGTWILDVVSPWTDSVDLWQKRTFVATAFGGKSNVRFRIRAITGGYESVMAVDDFAVEMFEPNDAGVTAILEPGVACAGTLPVRVRVKNFGTNVINSVTINWEINGTPQAPFFYNVAPIAIGDSVEVVIGSMTLVSGQTYTVEAYTSSPNGMSDPQTANDETIRPGIQSSLNGTYTIGGASPNYVNFTAAVNAMMTYGVCGPVVFNVRNGTYTEQIRLSQIAGTSATNTITFQSQNGDSSLVKLTYSSVNLNNYVVKLDTQSYVTFLDMTFEATGVSYGIVFEITGGSHYNRILNCRLISNAGGTTSYFKSLIYSSTASADNYNEFRNNLMENGANGFTYYGAFAAYDTGTVIDNNEIYCFGSGITLIYQNAPQITRNIIRSNVFQTYTASIGIALSQSSGQTIITDNNINIVTGAYGMQLQECVASTGQESLVANNMVHVGGSTAYGLYTSGNTSNINFYHNTFQVSSTNASSGRTFYLSSSGVNCRFLNNLITNTGGGYAWYVAISPITESNYNDIFSSGSNLGFWLSGNITSLGGWQFASSQDGNSVSVNPGYLSNNDLHVTSAGVDGKGTAIPSIPTDIDGEPRSGTAPDIGADEFVPPAKELSVVKFIQPPVTGCFGGQTQVTIKLFNNGTQAQTGFTVGYKVYAIVVATETVTATIAPGDSLIYAFNTTVNISPAGNYPFSAWVQLSGDANPYNDTIVGHLVTNTGVISSFPYVQDFEGGPILPQGWTNVTTDGTENWNFANTGSTITFDHTKGTSAGYFGWIDDNAPHSVKTELLTPCFDLSALTTPMLEFWFWSSNPSPSVMLHIDVLDNNVWTNDVLGPYGFQSANSWKYVLEPLTAFAGHPIKIRFRAEEVGTGNSSDIGIDDVVIFEPAPYNTALATITSPVSGCLSPQENVTIDIRNVGLNTLIAGTQIPVGYSVDGGPEVNETFTLSSPLPSFDTATYTFTAQADLSGGASIQVTSWASLAGDNDQGNDTTSVLLTATPYVDLGTDTTLCTGSSLVLNAGNPGATYQWDNSSTSQTRNVSTSGTYFVAVTQNGCTRRDTIVVTFIAPPAASFSMVHVSGNEYSFTNTSVGGTSVLWDFGDGFTSTVNNPNHIYLSNGSFTVMLIVTNACSSDTATQQIVVGIDEPAWMRTLTLTPNPVSDALMIVLDVSTGQPVGLRITDVAGRTVVSRVITGKMHTLTVSDLRAGMYLLEVSVEGALATRKFVVTK